ncbi:molecular chaperone Hsp90 [Streptomyces sp. RKND-216]|uniref:sacsin N-terminal ATP-binding-like domain-containing protein n=1 Tax=Streptomyces sp. RKND-216 TaxID=2562581 RepID=UPI00109DFDC4|nr:molecular chaperone Hsp90 [Streptomyces sp. RKND-216]THA27743.1 molecular chaperone Hsp90 [Streptomyces sp. RKND-216]
MVGQGGGEDPFGTLRLRRGVLDAWSASPARFREDANAEQDLALGGYRDRLVVELAQNAADAAGRAGLPGRIRFTLRGDVLVAANTGAALDAAAVESLSTLRASAKREDHGSSSGAGEAVGRFGVGFAAVLAVTDAPAVLSRAGGVRWSLTEARDLTLAEAGERTDALADEVRRRDGHVPLLRLPLPAEGGAPEGYDTAVVLPLRDAAAAALAERLLASVDDALLLALPGLAEVVVDTPDGVRTLTRRTDGPYVVVDDAAEPVARTEGPTPPAVRHHTRWRVSTAGGRVDPDLFADRPVEERLRPWWTVTWAIPVDDAGAPVRPRTEPVLHAPTPTDEPLGVPALLVASFPLEPTRRHVAPGPLADFLLARAAETYAGLLEGWGPAGTGLVDLVPGPLGKGELDGELRRMLLERLPDVAFLPSAAALAHRSGRGPADGSDEALRPLRPREAELIEGAGAETVRVLAELYPALLPAGLERRSELRALDVGRVPLGEAVDRLAGVERDPAWWRRLYDALAGVDPDRLSGLPVPLADGRTVIGPRQVLMPSADGAGPAGAHGDPGERHRALARLGLRVAHPDAVHPLLEKLGATPATPRAVLTTPQVREAVAGSLDAGEIWDEDADTPDADALAETVLALVRDAGLAPGDEPWLGALALPDEDGELAPAGELVLPGSAFARVIRDGELPACDAALAERWGEQPLTAVGVLADFALVRAGDVVLDPDEVVEPEIAHAGGEYAAPDDTGLLDAVDVWCEDVLDRLPETPVPPVAAELVAVRDLDLVDDDHWPEALAMLARPPLREALTTPVRVLLPDGTRETVRPYTAWWLRGHPVLDGRRPAGLRAAGGDGLLAGLYEEADASALVAPDGDGAPDEQVLRALGVRTSAVALLDEPGGAAELLARLADPGLPVSAQQLHGLYGLLAGLDPDEVTLPDELRAVVGGTVRVVAAAEAVVVEAPDLMPLLGDRPMLPVRSARAADLASVLDVRRLGDMVPGTPGGDPGTRRDVPEAVRHLLPTAPTEYLEHDELLVDGVEVDWRMTPDGTLHAATLEGVAAGLAWAAGAWARRFELAALLEDPSRAGELARARWFE